MGSSTGTTQTSHFVGNVGAEVQAVVSREDGLKSHRRHYFMVTVPPDLVV